MKVMWIVNTIFPYPSEKMKIKKSVFGGWMQGLMNSLLKNDEISLAVVSTYIGKELKSFYDGKVYYYLLPTYNQIKYDKKLCEFYQEVCNKFKPDLVHIHGTEYPNGLAFMNAFPNIKTVISIQGLVSAYEKLYLLNISAKDVIKNITFRDIVKFDNLFRQKKKFYNRGKYEIQMVKKCNYIIGRTSWDYSEVMGITDINKYRKCNESLRDSFYNKKWNYRYIEKNTIFVSQASYPIKGFHDLIKALPIVKKRYPNIKVYVAGNNIIDRTCLKNRLKLSGYGKYIIKLMKKNDVFDNINFVGLLNEEEMLNLMMKCNIFVQSSILENSPNSLGEAMLIGMPIVASDVGGTSDMLENTKDGLLYPYAESNLLAERIIRVLDNYDDAIMMGNNARKHAQLTHDRDKNANKMVEIYKEIIQK